MEDIFSVIFMNFWGYDLIIFIAAVLTGIMYYYLRQSADRLYNKMHLTVFVPDEDASRREADMDISGLRETDIVKMRNHTGKLYSIFVNLTGIFPLLGILGTVVSLLGLVADSTDVTGNFYGALTSTFWGLIFAIIFKFLDGIISAKIEDNEKTVALYLERNSSGERKAVAEAAQSLIRKPVAVHTHEAERGTESSVVSVEGDETFSEIIIAPRGDRNPVAEILSALNYEDDKQ